MADQPTRIPLTAVQSSALTAYGYDEATRALDVQFSSGAIHRYGNVPVGLFADMQQAESVGRFFAREIKNRHNWQKMTGECPLCGAAHGWLGETCEDCGAAVYGGEV